VPNCFRVFVLQALIIASTAALASDQATADIYASKCYRCHGNNGGASRVGRELGAKRFQDPQVSNLSVSQFADIIREGKNKMPSFKGKLSDQEINDLAKYVKELK
jgi:cytochrome c6